MKLTARTLQAIANVITGDTKLSPYRSGPELVRFFREFGSEASYGKGFPTRFTFAYLELERLNDTALIDDVLLAAVDPRDFIGTDFDPDVAIGYLNKYLDWENCSLVKAGKIISLEKNVQAGVEFQGSIAQAAPIDQAFIDQQNEKCTQKLVNGDYDGAITNARSLLETVLLELERKLTSSIEQRDGDLVKLNKRVSRLLNLEPDRKDISDALSQVLRGMVSIVNGLSALSNKMGDRHAVSYKPDKHHAQLVVNAARTYVQFLYDTHEYQLRKGRL